MRRTDAFWVLVLERAEEALRDERWGDFADWQERLREAGRPSDPGVRAWIEAHFKRWERILSVRRRFFRRHQARLLVDR